jgi:hypothetical protein
MNLETYSKYFVKDDTYTFVKDEYKSDLNKLVCNDVLEIFDKYIPIGSDYRHDWKFIDYYYLLRDMMKEHKTIKHLQNNLVQEEKVLNEGW